MLRACTLYYNWVRYAQNSDPYDQLKKLSQKLAMERPIANPNETNIDTDNGGLIATLKQEVDNMDEQERFPITRPESKSAVNTLINLVKKFDLHLKTQPKDETKESRLARINTMIGDFQKVINEWNNYRRSYLSNDFLNEMQLAKSEASPEQQQGFDNRIRLWTKFVQLTDSVIEQINTLLKQQLSNPSSSSETTPV